LQQQTKKTESTIVNTDMDQKLNLNILPIKAVRKWHNSDWAVILII